MTSLLGVSDGVTLGSLLEYLERLKAGGFPLDSGVEFKVQQNMHERSNTPMAPTVRMKVTYHT